MSWTAPHTFATGEIVTAATLNNNVSNDLTFLGGTAGAAISTAQNTASTSYTDLATVGPAVTLTTLTTVAVDILTAMTNAGSCTYGIMGVAVSGATTLAAADAQSIQQNTGVVGVALADQVGGRVYLSGLTGGSNSLTAKYRVAAGTCTFGGRTLCGTPLTA